MRAQLHHEGDTTTTVRPPAYDEIDRVMASNLTVDLQTFLRESRCSPHELGKKKLSPPQYNCTVSHSGTVSRKFESVINQKGFVEYPYRRNWTRVFAVVRGTMLEIYRTSTVADHTGSPSGAIVSTPGNAWSRRAASLPPDSLDERLPNRSRSASTPSRYDGVAPLEFLHSYSLAGVVVGIANDYIKKDNVLRVRAENDQFLFHCRGSQDTIDWLETFQAAANIADPLDTRVEPRKLCLSLVSSTNAAGFYSAPRRSRVPTRQQAYEIFESMAPTAPLRQKTYISIWPQSRFRSLQNRSTTGSGNSSATRQSEATSPDVTVTESATSDTATLTREPSSDIIRPSPVAATDYSVPRCATTSAGKNKSARPASSPQRPIKAERFLCAILPSTSPRFVLPMAPTISC